MFIERKSEQINRLAELLLEKEWSMPRMSNASSAQSARMTSKKGVVVADDDAKAERHSRRGGESGRDRNDAVADALRLEPENPKRLREPRPSKNPELN